MDQCRGYNLRPNGLLKLFFILLCPNYILLFKPEQNV